MVHLLLAAVILAAPQDTIALDIDEAVTRAVAMSPLVAAAEGAIAAPRGERAESWWPFPNNPSVEFARTRRRGLGTTVYDREWSVTQQVEIAGQWLLRRGAAGKRVRAAEARRDNARRLTALQARTVYVRLAVGERRAALADSNAVFASRMAEFARRQLNAGEVSRLEYNAALLEAARTRSAADRAAADRDALAAELAMVLALAEDSTPRTAGVPDRPALETVSDRATIAAAQVRRPDMRAALFASEATTRDLTLARLSVLPTLELSGFSGREDGTDGLFGFSIGLRVPLFRRGQAQRGIARAERAIARAEVDAVERLIRAQILAATARYRRARSAEKRFASDVLGAATENVTLTERALAEGEASVTDVIVLRTAAVNAQLEYLDVLLDLYSSWFDLAAAVAATPAELADVLK